MDRRRPRSTVSTENRTIFPPVSKADPKHGRWILPLVIAGLVLFTYLFVNALPPGPSGTDGANGDGNGGTGGDTSAPVDGEDATTTTSQPDAETAAFLAAIDDFTTRSAELADEAQSLNDDYDAGTIEFAAIRDGLTEVQDDTDDLVTEITDLEVPAAASDAWADVISAGNDMSTAAAEMIDGLVNTTGSEKRLAELENYQTAATELAAALAEAAGSV